ncbi:MAG: serine hydrolase [Lachnospiraceae bacterium]|nr:D-alanyl-D-alanine carboxypeptidase [Lachnospiraceae bacterium]MEE1341731.1 serine hydrolase [Lachnospiraceae bacterium]
MKKQISLLFVFILLLTGCSKQPLKDSFFKTANTLDSYKMIQSQETKGISNDLAVIEKDDITPTTFQATAKGMLLVNETKNEYLVAKQPFKKIYPASLTKVLTAYVVMKYGNLEDEVTIKSDITFNEEDVKVCFLQKGDKVSVETLLHGLLIASENDCAVALARYISGNQNKFVALMNQEAKLLGATNSHFMNPHGLHNKNHYTTPYDLYLIFHAASQYEIFNEIIQKPTYTMVYKNAFGQRVTFDLENTNQYINKDAKLTQPNLVTVLGGKTGTTENSGSSLILLSKSKTDTYISVVTNEEDKEHLYQTMTQLLNEVTIED